MDLWQWHCQNRREKKCCNWFVAMPLPKMGGRKIVVAEIWEGLKKKNAMSTIFLQQITCDQFLIISSNLNLILKLLF